jgi:hypothetical protein
MRVAPETEADSTHAHFGRGTTREEIDAVAERLSGTLAVTL